MLFQNSNRRRLCSHDAVFASLHPFVRRRILGPFSRNLPRMISSVAELVPRLRPSAAGGGGVMSSLDS